MNDFVFILRGEARVRLFDASKLEHLAQRYHDQPFDVIRDMAISNCMEFDSGWSSNTITDTSRISIAIGTAFGSNLNIFIHQNTNPGSTFANTFLNAYSSQTPSQVRAPDTETFDQTLLVQTRTTQFAAPSVARDINIIGLTYGSTTVSNNTLTGVAAYTLLSSTIVQGTSQVADVQYRVTFSMDD